MYIKPKKSLAQYFLVDRNIQRKICAICSFDPSETVLEIGAGRGELTRLIAPQVKKVYALEIDANLTDVLKITLAGFANVKIINQDILKFNLRKYFSYSRRRLKVFGNIPYYISSGIIEHLLKFKDKIDTIFITVQKEFARRVTAKPGTKDYGSLSCFVQYYTEPRIALNIKRTSFFPVPRVDSSLLELKIRKRPLVRPKNPDLFFKIIRNAFNKRRKTLRNSLKEVIPRQNLELFFSNYGIDRNVRPEGLSLQDFANLTNI